MIQEKLRELLPPALIFSLRYWRSRLRARSKYVSWPYLCDPGASAKHIAGGRLIVFDDHLPAPDRDAGSARMAVILRTLTKLGEVTFVSLSEFEPPEYQRQLDEAGVETVRWTEYRRLLRERRFDIAILSRADVAGALLPSIKRLAPGIKIIFDTVDIPSVRLEREYEMTGNKKAARVARRYHKLEKRLVRACDQVWCVTNEDQAVLSRGAAGTEFEIIPTIHALQDRGKSFSERHGVVFIGNFLHRPNVDAVHHFMREIYPLICVEFPAIKVFIVGDQAPPEFAAYASDTVVITGYLPDVDSIFQSCRVFIAPLRFGSGIKGKIGQALSYGLPVVTTTIGAEGMDLKHERNAMVADEPREFGAALMKLHENAELWQRLSDNGYDHIAKHFTPEVVEVKIRRAIKL